MNNLTNSQVNFQTLNLCNSLLQGKFVYFNILHQAGSPLFDSDEFNELKDRIKKVSSLLKKMEEGEGIININNAINNETEKYLFNILDGFKKEFIKLSKSISSEINSGDEWQRDKDGLSFLVATYGYYSYIEENFLKKLLVYHKENNNENAAIEIEYLLNDAQDSIALTGNFLKSIKKPGGPEKGFYPHLLYFLKMMPGYYRAKAHDANQLCKIKEGFTFKDTDISEEEIEKWESYGISAVEAVYWKSYDFSIIDTITWKKVGFASAKMSSEWKLSGFSAEEARAWISFYFTPLLAIQWSNAGFNPEQSYTLVNKEFLSPEDLPKEKEEIVKLLEEDSE